MGFWRARCDGAIAKPNSTVPSTRHHSYLLGRVIVVASRVFIAVVEFLSGNRWIIFRSVGNFHWRWVFRLSWRAFSEVGWKLEIVEGGYRHSVPRTERADVPTVTWNSGSAPSIEQIINWLLTWVVGSSIVNSPPACAHLGYSSHGEALK